MIFFLLPAFANAQTITRQNFPNVGENYQAVFAGNYGVYGSWPSGNQTWDFSGWTSTAGDTLPFNYSTVSSTSPFAGSEMTVGMAGLGDLFFSSSSNSYELTGTRTTFNGETVEAPYNQDYQTLVTFPFTYADNFKDTAKGTFSDTYTSIGFPIDATIIRTTHSETTADGSGTVILPGKTYSDILRIKITSTIIDSVYQTGTTTLLEVFTSTTEEYLYVAEGFKHQIIYANQTIPDGSTTPINTVLYFTNPVDLNPLSTKNASNNLIELYPNPASDAVSVAGLRSGTEAEIVIFSASGEQLATLKNNGQTFSIPENLNTGLYFYSISENGVVVKTGKINIQ